MFKTKKQLLLRFLKNNRIYKRFLDEKPHLIRGVCNDNISIRFFDHAFCWGGTVEGHNYWLKKQCDFVLFVIENDKNDCFLRNTVREYFYLLINSGYFSERGLDKTSEYYNSFKEKFEKIFGN